MIMAIIGIFISYWFLHFEWNQVKKNCSSPYDTNYYYLSMVEECIVWINWDRNYHFIQSTRCDRCKTSNLDFWAKLSLKCQKVLNDCYCALNGKKPRQCELYKQALLKCLLRWHELKLINFNCLTTFFMCQVYCSLLQQLFLLL